MQISYEQAVAAHERGEKVEMRSILGLSWKPFTGQKLGQDYKFRPADPCAELKAAQSQGKVPDELNIEAGKEYIDDPITRDPNIWRVLCTDALGKFPVVAISGYELSRFNMEGKSESGFWTLIAPYAPAPAPYDNWQHLPAWAQWQVQMKNGQWFFSSDKPKNYDNLAAAFGWYLGENGHGSLPSKYYPTNYSDHWEASLQERPKQ